MHSSSHSSQVYQRSEGQKIQVVLEPSVEVEMSVLKHISDAVCIFNTIYWLQCHYDQESRSTVRN